MKLAALAQTTQAGFPEKPQAAAVCDMCRSPPPHPRAEAPHPLRRPPLRRLQRSPRPALEEDPYRRGIEVEDAMDGSGVVSEPRRLSGPRQASGPHVRPQDKQWRSPRSPMGGGGADLDALSPEDHDDRPSIPRHEGRRLS